MMVYEDRKLHQGVKGTELRFPIIAPYINKAREASQLPWTNTEKRIVNPLDGGAATNSQPGKQLGFPLLNQSGRTIFDYPQTTLFYIKFLLKVLKKNPGFIPPIVDDNTPPSVVLGKLVDQANQLAERQNCEFRIFEDENKVTSAYLIYELGIFEHVSLEVSKIRSYNRNPNDYKALLSALHYLASKKGANLPTYFNVALPSISDRVRWSEECADEIQITPREVRGFRLGKAGKFFHLMESPKGKLSLKQLAAYKSTNPKISNWLAMVIELVGMGVNFNDYLFDTAQYNNGEIPLCEYFHLAWDFKSPIESAFLDDMSNQSMECGCVPPIHGQSILTDGWQIKPNVTKFIELLVDTVQIGDQEVFV